MPADIVVPELGESVTEAIVVKWLKAEGDAVATDELLVELETDKVSVEINAQSAGVLSEILAAEGAEVNVGAVLGRIGDGAAPAKSPAKSEPAPAKAEPAKEKAPPPAEQPAPAPAAAPPAAAPSPSVSVALSPAVRKLVEDNKLDPSAIPPTGRGGRLTNGDVLGYLSTAAPAPAAPAPSAAPPPTPSAAPAAAGPREERVKMSRLRQRIAARLKEAQNTAAILTTFNEVDMTNVMAARKQYRDSFEKKHGVRLGFMSFFVKACIVALREIPEVNAEIDGDEIIYKNHYDIGVAVGTGKGLVVPVVRDADRLDFAGIEQTIASLGRKARDGKLTVDDLTGGTFTISNGGVYGSMLSTPILNPPQSGILGMHNIQPRAVVVDGEIVVRPMMYLAMSYDHRIVDGSEAVTFLVRIKNCIEDPQRILLDI